MSFKKLISSPVGTILWFIIVIGVMELLIMLVLSRLALPRSFYAILGPLIVAIVIGPLLYLYIARHMKAEKVLRQSQQKYQTLVDSIDGIVWEADARTFQFSFVSKQAERLLGYPVDRWLTESTFWSDHIHADDREFAVDFCVKATAEKRPHEFEYRMIAADGRPVWLRDIVTVVVENDQPVKLRGVMVDIIERKRVEEELERHRDHLDELVKERTAELEKANQELRRAFIERRWAEEALRESEELHRLTLANISDAVFITDNSGKFTFIFPNVDLIFGYSYAEVEEFGNIARLLGDNLFDISKLEASGEMPNIEREITDKAGNGHWLLVNVKRVSIKGGAVLYSCRDITERKQAEAALKESEQKFRDLTEQSPNIIYINKRGRVIYANKKAEEIMGYKREEFYSPDFDFLSLVIPEYRDLAMANYNKRMKGEEVAPYEYALVTKEGKRIEAINTSTLITYEGEPAILGTATDITERKRAEEERTRGLGELEYEG